MGVFVRYTDLILILQKAYSFRYLRIPDWPQPVGSINPEALSGKDNR